MPSEKKVLENQLNDLMTAKKAGYQIPDPLIDMVRNKLRELEGVLEIWECSRCSQKIEMYVRATEVSHSCRKAKNGKMKVVWSHPTLKKV